MNAEPDILQLAGTLLGGLGLFMLGVSMVTDGMRLAAGNSLRELLARSTRTSWHGIGSGLLMTALVQSSSAVTVATIGFVNAGLLGLSGALAIVLGAAVGTTMTGWLVAAIGFQFKITVFALPMVGVGMVLRLLGPSRRNGALGEALAGFGLFFIGIDFLRTAFEGVAQGIDLAALAPESATGVLLFAGIGLVMTVLTQSSSAAIAIILTAAGGGLVPFAAAAAAVIGATVGTTSTSALAVLAATAQARRVAAGHVLVNGFNALLGLCLLPVLLWVVGRYPELAAAPALMLAIFHSCFNVAGMLLLWPWLNRMAALLGRYFRSPVEDIGRPQFLDRNVLASPVVAVDAFFMELQRLNRMSREHASKALTIRGGSSRTLKQQHDGIRQLVMAIEYFTGSLEVERLPREVAERLSLVLRIANYLDEATATAQEAAEQASDVDELMASVLREDIKAYQRAVLALIEQCDTSRENFDFGALQHQYDELRGTWRSLKTALLNAGASQQIPVVRLNSAIEKLRFMLRVSERLMKAAMRLSELSAALPRTRQVAAGESSQPASVAQEDSRKEERHPG
ncbi:MAG: Na/Pi symporter [Pseudohongiellaceae bacterium]